MWQLFEDNSLIFNFWYFLVWNIIFFLGMTIFSVPYVAMGYEMSSDYHERTRLMAVAQWIGQWAWVIAPWFWIVLYDPNWFESATEGARTLSIWVGLICMGLAIVPAVLCRSDDNSHEEKEAIGSLSDTFNDLWRGVLITLANKPFQKVCEIKRKISVKNGKFPSNHIVCNGS